jgi:hypothetical protein
VNAARRFASCLARAPARACRPRAAKPPAAGPANPLWSRLATGDAGRASGRAAIGYFLPSGGGEGAGSAGTSTAPGPTPPASGGTGAAPTCKVKSFKMKFGKWNSSWPSLIGSKYTKRLPVSFDLELDSPSTKADCVIGQDKKGEVEAPGYAKDTFASWTTDGPVGHRSWWDGKDWHAGFGSWGWFSETASWSDEPGFYELAKANFPIYYGGVGRKGHFEFRTYVADKATGTTVRTLTWGMLINYSDPAHGSEYFYT